VKSPTQLNLSKSFIKSSLNQNKKSNNKRGIENKCKRKKRKRQSKKVANWNRKKNDIFVSLLLKANVNLFHFYL